ncbi:MAG: hypothetical protein AAF787_00220 [Chloroflexota bacterium]
MEKITPIAITTEGSDGSATGTGSSSYPVSGRVVGVHLDYSASQAATTDVTITAIDPDLPVLVVANNTTDGWYFPVTTANLNTDGSEVSGEVVRGVPVDGYLAVSVAGGNDGETVTVTILVERC